MFTISQSAVEQALNDIRTGNTEFSDQFFASRPDWQDKDDSATTQTDNKQSEKEGQAKA